MKSANHDSKEFVARQNALLALQTAFGEVQRQTGPDQRITGSAGLMDSDPETSEIDDINEPYWTGVWDQRGTLLSWLVSGNEGLEPSDADFISPSALPLNVQSMYSDGSVEVPLRPIESGAYAYWVSDENVKANINLADATLNTEPLVSAQMMDISRMSELEWILAVSGQKEARANLSMIESLDLMASSAAEKESIDDRRFDLAANSFGVLANVAKGGLKRDLTLALYDGSELPSGQIFDPISGAKSLSDPGGPTWQQLKSWVDIPDSGPLEVRSQHDNQTGLAPVVTQFQFYTVPRTQVDLLAGTQEIFLDIYPAITLWNPYDRRIRINNGLIDVARRYWDFRYGGSGGAFRWSYLPFHAWLLKIVQNGIESRYDDDSSPQFPNQTVLNTNDHNGLHFSIGTVDLDPGESVTFSPPAGSKSPMSMNKTDYYALTPGFHPDGSYYFLTDISGSDALSYDPSDPPVEFVLRATRNATLAVTLRDGDEILQELYHLGGIAVITAPQTDLLPLGSSDMTGSIGIKVIRNFTDWGTLDGSEDRSIQWISHLNPRGSYQGAIPYFFRDTMDTIVNRHTNNPSVFSSSTHKGDQQLGLNNVGSGWSISSSYLDETVLFESSLSRSRLRSIGQLMHASLFHSGVNRSQGSLYNREDAESDAGNRIRYGRFDNTIPAYAIGNSEADPSIPLDAVVVEWRENDYTDSEVYDFLRIQGRHYDYSYLLNEALWDSYFFSALSNNSSRHSANSRLVPLDDSQTNALKSHEVAAEFMVEGAFNVNSVSEEAWRALLGSFFGQASLDGEFASPIVRILDESAVLFDPASDDAQEEPAYRGYRALTQDQIINLAHQIVEEIKWRRLGRNKPFSSLSGFVNRQPYEDAPTGVGSNNSFRLRGVLSAALDRADKISADESSELGVDQTRSTINRALQDNLTQTETSNVIAGFTTQAMEGWRSEGLPGWLTQADLLARLGSVLAVRSDTFKIRVYGESRNPLDNRVDGKAWGEATLQRLPNYLNSDADSASSDVDSLTDPVNERFGRRYVLTGFRWMDSN
ncbi:hypothetical protein [Puniceicoccus vermicola]|uniref:Uncharacterized protein n=1 Tax=Puniceicoccus vermicola TaxID=388746 RepID=A0A7X1E6I2_9BACT|nr:hypothetical protein [Puniceicoccus vermicola]MBC2602707.1 hypothetical protein [Puniceicoccus vermicola]